MQTVVNTFRSELVNTNSADFMTAQKDPEVMKKWAASRELFSSKVTVTNKIGDKKESNYLMPLNMSGQLVSLKPQICQPGERPGQKHV